MMRLPKVNELSSRARNPGTAEWPNVLVVDGRLQAGYNNPEVEKLIEAQSAERDRAKRLKIVGEIERLLVEDGARPIINHGAANTCWQPAVKGIVLQQNSIYNSWRFDTVWLDR